MGRRAASGAVAACCGVFTILVGGLFLASDAVTGLGIVLIVGGLVILCCGFAFVYRDPEGLRAHTSATDLYENEMLNHWAPPLKKRKVIL